MKIVHYTFQNSKTFPSVYKGFSGFLFSICQTRDKHFKSIEENNLDPEKLLLSNLIW
jgi:hypothetical protein